MKRAIISSAAFLVTMATACEPFQNQEPPKKPEAKVRELMRKKLVHSQKLLEAVVTTDYIGINSNAKALRDISEVAEWRVFPTPEYLLHSAEFQRVADTMIKNAKDKNLDAAALSYVELTLNCVRCHKYVRSQRMTFNDSPDRVFALK